MTTAWRTTEVDTDHVRNVSAVPGSTASDAIEAAYNAALAAGAATTDDVENVSDVPGANTSDALEYLLANTAAVWGNIVGDHTQQADLMGELLARAPVVDPVLQGDPHAPTPLSGDNSTSIATTAFVHDSLAAMPPVAWGTIAGTLSDQTDLQTALDEKTTSAYVDAAVTAEADARIAADALLAPLSSPVFTGNPTAPTPSPGDSDTTIATTAFVAGAVSSSIAAVLSDAAPQNVTKATASAGVAATAARVDHKHDVSTAVVATTAGVTSSEGTSVALARADHVHRTELGIRSAGVAIGSRPRLNFTGATVTDNAGTDSVDVAISTPTWAQVLAAGNTSGANDAVMSSAGVALRGADSTTGSGLTLRGGNASNGSGGSVAISGGSSTLANSGSSVTISPGSVVSGARGRLLFTPWSGHRPCHGH